MTIILRGMPREVGSRTITIIEYFSPSPQLKRFSGVVVDG